MNFQILKRVMCCLLVLMLVFGCCVRPITAYAIDPVTAYCLGVALKTAILSAVVSLGLNASERMAEEISFVVSSVYAAFLEDGTAEGFLLNNVLPVITFKNNTYMQKNFLAKVLDAIKKVNITNDDGEIEPVMCYAHPVDLYVSQAIDLLEQEAGPNNGQDWHKAVWRHETFPVLTSFVINGDKSPSNIILVWSTSEPLWSCIDGNLKVTLQDDGIVGRYLGPGDVYWEYRTEINGLLGGADFFHTSTGTVTKNVYHGEFTVGRSIVTSSGATVSDTIDGYDKLNAASGTFTTSVSGVEESYVPVVIHDNLEQYYGVPYQQIVSGSGSTVSGTTMDNVTVEVNKAPVIEEEVVTPPSDTGTVDSATLWDWLKLIWQAICEVITNTNAFLSQSENIFAGVEQLNAATQGINQSVSDVETAIRDGNAETSTALGTITTRLTGMYNLLVQNVVQPLAAINIKLQSVLNQLSAGFTDVKSIADAVSNIGKTITDAITSALSAVFVPTEGYFDAKVEMLKSKFPLFDSVWGTANELKSFLLNLGSVPPIIYIDLAAGSGWHYMGGKTIFVDLTWYAAYKPTMDTVLSAFLWLWFIWRMLMALPGILQGTSGFWGKSDPVTETGMTLSSQWYDRR